MSSTGPGETTGAALVQHPRVKKISFTGDCANRPADTGDDKDHIRTLTLELGGSDPMIVMADADIPKAVEGALRGRFYNAGQICTAVKRLYLHEKIAEEFISLLTAKVEGLVLFFLAEIQIFYDTSDISNMVPNVNQDEIQNHEKPH